MQFPEVVTAYFHGLVIVAAAEHGLPPDQILDRRRKSDARARAREQIAAHARAHIGTNGGPLEVFADGLPIGASPISYPKLGRLMGGFHHTAVLQMERRYHDKEASTDEQENKQPENAGGQGPAGSATGFPAGAADRRARSEGADEGSSAGSLRAKAR
jgi:hypothetical protein